MKFKYHAAVAVRYASPSVRRAWVEMLTLIEARRRSRVALRKEGVG